MVEDLDSYDWKLLRALQEDSRLSHVELSEKVNLSPSQCARRLQRLEALGVVRGYTTILDQKKIGLGLTALVHITLERQAEATVEPTRRAILAMPEVVECLMVTGDNDYQLKVVVRDLEAFSAFINQKLMTLPGLQTMRSNIVLDQMKPYEGLPLG
ncbi:Lrp/AsnC family transcriptional regulator [Pedomonas mirosovicensis]|uniref:Lrp/AsnC family transcriptional regulator n=1 Tax=Pedomonas mirosovicensis TaxID=2908641 RepID=UPI00216A09E2|nr:Lrp/AsnC family transcriptional regulator [Pedomonas mirosovicensis]MCH8685711.1 Lrp/AsnC family transcriptional regulator [Pedomonas mirosovicensis]